MARVQIISLEYALRQVLVAPDPNGGRAVIAAQLCPKDSGAFGQAVRIGWVHHGDWSLVNAIALDGLMHLLDAVLLPRAIAHPESQRLIDLLAAAATRLAAAATDAGGNFVARVAVVINSLNLYVADRNQGNLGGVLAADLVAVRTRLEGIAINIRALQMCDEVTISQVWSQIEAPVEEADLEAGLRVRGLEDAVRRLLIDPEPGNGGREVLACSLRPIDAAAFKLAVDMAAAEEPGWRVVNNNALTNMTRASNILYLLEAALLPFAVAHPYHRQTYHVMLEVSLQLGVAAREAGGTFNDRAVEITDMLDWYTYDFEQRTLGDFDTVKDRLFEMMASVRRLQGDSAVTIHHDPATRAD